MSFTADRAISLLEASHQQRRLAHAYLITGPEGAGKKHVAGTLMNLVNETSYDGTENLDAFRSATTTLITPESKSRRITIESIRNAEHTLQMAAPSGVTKFAVILDADRMSEQAVNAFLKTLEEPPSGSMLILVTNFPELLLDTILSRCIRINLTRKPGPIEVTPTAKQLLDHLKKNVQADRSGVSVALGLVKIFSDLLKEEKSAISKRYEAEHKVEVQMYQKASEGDYLKQREDHYEALATADYLESRNRLLEYFRAWFGDALRQQNHSPHLDLPEYAPETKLLSQKQNLQQLGKKIDAVQELRDHLNTNVQESLAIETAFLKLFA